MRLESQVYISLIRRSLVGAQSAWATATTASRTLGVVMRSPSRRAASAAGTLTVLIGLAIGAGALPATAPPTPEDLELHAGADTSITLEWEASPGATSYRVYRGTASGAEAATPIATITGTTYKDANLSPTPIYFYQVSAVNAAGES